MRLPLTIAFLAFAYGSPLLGADQTTDWMPPNVLLIYSDDQGTFDLNCYGSQDLETPNLDNLAKRGVRFTNMYSPSAICSASRAGLLTGRFPVRAGVPGNVSSQEGVAGMSPSEVTIAEQLKAAGYVTGHVGKWHLGYTKETMPNAQGFDTSFGHMGGCIDNYSHYFYWQGPNRHDLWRNAEMTWEDGAYFPDLMVRECKSFMETNRDKPFFLYWALNIPHYPMQGENRWRQHYRHLESPRRQYAELVSTMDEKIGLVLDHLEELGLTDKTLVVFQSDHGHSTEERAFFGGGNAGDLRGAKGCLFEGGIRVPSIASLPGVIPANQVREQLACGIDWFPTVSELCGVESFRKPLDGKSLVNVLHDRDVATPHDFLYWHLGGGKRPQWAIRDGNWKLLGNPTDRSNKAEVETTKDGLFLVDLGNNEEERTNVANGNTEIIERLQRRRSEILKSLSDNP
ncbi:sulfatase-like hydrolase/transferase [Novipirellula artificiosorum]|uniref:Arylsulfatase n=1 Tax=Novipirellula artificiosorum TaxID=2528016 RepID=A0A5C6DXD1_9BACT|nr:sulfatase-like hydrolase/transferase [Novipirellula artificiosorum]TWU40547.1 Arylsulfatase [Novipirellula artificiosorum]